MDIAARDRSLPPAEPTLEWEESPCPLCAGERWDPIIEGTDPLPGADGLRFLVVRCRTCGLSFTNPRPSERSIGRFYPTDYVCHRGHGQKPARPPRRWRRDPVAQLLPRHGRARLLDFGCGAGEFLCRMSAQGWDVTGLDACEPVVRRIREEFGLPAHTGTLPHPALPDGSFEAVTMWQALEHVHRPLETLQAVHRLLTPGGRVLVAVPNIDSLPFHWFAGAWYALDVPRHLTHFSPTTLRQMLLRAGFERADVRMVRHPGWIRHSARLLARRSSAAPALARLLTTRLISGLASWYSYLTRRSDCILAVATRS